MMKIKNIYNKTDVNNKMYSYTFSEIYFINYALKNKWDKNIITIYTYRIMLLSFCDICY